MMTAKHLQVLAESLADLGALSDLDEEETVTASKRVIADLQRVNGVTGNFDPARFEAAVRAAYRGE